MRRAPKQPCSYAERGGVPREERRLGQRREQARLRADAHDRLVPVPERADLLAVDEHARLDARVRFVITTSGPRGTTSGRMWSACGATNVSTIASSPQTSTGPPFERL